MHFVWSCFSLAMVLFAVNNTTMLQIPLTFGTTYPNTRVLDIRSVCSIHGSVLFLVVAVVAVLPSTHGMCNVLSSGVFVSCVLYCSYNNVTTVPTGLQLKKNLPFLQRLGSSLLFCCHYSICCSSFDCPVVFRCFCHSSNFFVISCFVSFRCPWSLVAV